MTHQILTYLKWFPKTFYLHGIHSPFVFKLRKECLKNNQATQFKNEILQYRQRLLGAEREIVVTDFGAGSRVFKSNTRKISQIARFAGATEKRMRLLQRLVAYFKPEQILELGTSLGMATFALAKGDNRSSITSLEGCPETAAVAQETFNHFNVDTVDLQIGRFCESISKLNKYKFDFIYFDGNHSKKATLEYVNSLLPTAINGSVWVFDDIHWSKEMTEAWNEIKKLPEIDVTVDCYELGLAFFRNEQVKEHFYIKI